MLVRQCETELRRIERSQHGLNYTSVCGFGVVWVDASVQRRDAGSSGLREKFPSSRQAALYASDFLNNSSLRVHPRSATSAL